MLGLGPPLGADGPTVLASATGRPEPTDAGVRAMYGAVAAVFSVQLVRAQRGWCQAFRVGTAHTQALSHAMRKARRR